jgi:hypothetical protein
MGPLKRAQGKLVSNTLVGIETRKNTPNKLKNIME